MRLPGRLWRLCLRKIKYVFRPLLKSIRTSSISVPSTLLKYAVCHQLIRDINSEPISTVSACFIGHFLHAPQLDILSFSFLSISAAFSISSGVSPCFLTITGQSFLDVRWSSSRNMTERGILSLFTKSFNFASHPRYNFPCIF